MLLRHYALIVLLAMAPGVLAVGGCTDLAAFTADTAASLSSPLPSQVTTLSEAALSADLVVIGTRTAVDTGKLGIGALTEIQSLRGAVRVAMDGLVSANGRGENLNFAIFSSALAAYRAYTVQEGISIPSKPPAPVTTSTYSHDDAKLASNINRRISL